MFLRKVIWGRFNFIFCFGFEKLYNFLKNMFEIVGYCKCYYNSLMNVYIGLWFR